MKKPKKKNEKRENCWTYYLHSIPTRRESKKKMRPSNQINWFFWAWASKNTLTHVKKLSHHIYYHTHTSINSKHNLSRIQKLLNASNSNKPKIRRIAPFLHKICIIHIAPANIYTYNHTPKHLAHRVFLDFNVDCRLISSISYFTLQLRSHMGMDFRFCRRT